MRRFLITSSAFTGEADILYDGDGRLVKLDLIATNMPAAIVNIFKEKVPGQIERLETAFTPGSVTIVETSYEVTFEMFWNKYDYKVNKKRCEPLWSKLSKASQVEAYIGVDAYNKFLKGTGWRKKADPEKYLRDHYWENEWK